MNEKETELKTYLELFRSLRGKNPPNGYTYRGVEDFLLQHGQWFKPRPLPKDIFIGAPKACFGNALLLAVTRGYRYIEGYAVPDINIVFPVHHAWNADENGNLIDNTWCDHGLAYLGVEFSTGRADNATWFDDAAILDNPKNRHAIFKQPWKGENFNLFWRKSKAYKQIERLKA